MTSSRKVAVGALLIGACVDAETSSDSTVDRPRLIAVLADPPESSPGSSVRFRAIVAAPGGPAEPALTWSFCSTPRGATENTAASPACILNAEQPLAGVATSIDAIIPSDACMRFGSETPSGRAPNTADATGGYYQPLRVALAPDDLTLVRHRIRCALPNVPLAAARDFNRDYVPNRAPRIAAIRAFAPDGEVELSSLPPTAELTFQVEVANDAREPYLRYDPRAGALTTAQERLSLAWYITSGAFDHPLLVVAQLTVENRWHTEDLRAGAWLWVVLRDDRGGIAVESRELSRVLCSPEPCTRTSARLSIRP